MVLTLAVCTRPDIAAAISSWSRFNAITGRAHWEGVQWTSGEGICYRKGVSKQLWGYYDSGHLTCPDTRRSRAGYVFLSASGAINWQSKLVGNASLSSCESEYMGLAVRRIALV